MNGVALAELKRIAGVAGVDGDEQVRVLSVTSDSRAVREGDLFAAIPGARSDGAAYAADAVERGARAVLAVRPLGLTVPTLLVDDVRKRLGPISQRVLSEPSHELSVVGITGTNGKTTVTYLIESVLAHAGKKPALLGTVAQRGPAGEAASSLTTPESDEIARFMRTQRDAGATHLAMEASSHAIAQDRVLGIRFDVAGFTNLTQDHLDFHGTMQAYGETKALLFTAYAPRVSVIMVDHTFGQQLARQVKGQVLRCATKPNVDAELSVQEWSSTRAGIRARIATPRGEVTLNSPLFGAHNLENLLVCLGSCLALGLDLTVIADALSSARGAPGRMERVADSRDVMVLVDYAHSPDAIERALSAVRPLTQGRLFAVCGCGGDRDRTKRAPMGAAAGKLADVAVLTSDNPRTEDPLAILREMEPGAHAHAPRIASADLANASRGYVVIPDRAEAIRLTIAAARAGDTVLLAGKGHEDYQILGTVKHPFDDRIEARAAIVAAGGG
jgi:UDP-N-acetylmuramoyl-L-alanyl-D-glutamate--2,6-diaminopimelate ligase